MILCGRAIRGSTKNVASVCISAEPMSAISRIEPEGLAVLWGIFKALRLQNTAGLR